MKSASKPDAPQLTAADPIPLADLTAQHAPLRAELAAAFERVLDSEQFILGPELSAFESEVASYLQVEHALGVSSGTDALLLALMALGIGAGDEVIVPAFSFFASAGCVARLGARPVFADIEPDTFNLDLARVQERISPNTKAIMPVHLYGQVCDLSGLRALCAERGLYLVEDAAQALGAGSAELRAGSVGEFGCFSFFPTKNLGALGDAGLVVARDATWAKRARLLRAHGAEPKYHHALLGGNFRLDALQAAFLRVKLPHLNAWNAARLRNAESYDRLFREAALPEDLLKTPVRRYAGHIFHQYVVRSTRRDALLAHLRAQHIGCEVYYPVPLHLQPCFAYLGQTSGSCPEAERAAREALALPIHAELTAGQIERVVSTISTFLT